MASFRAPISSSSTLVFVRWPLGLPPSFLSYPLPLRLLFARPSRPPVRPPAQSLESSSSRLSYAVAAALHFPLLLPTTTTTTGEKKEALCLLHWGTFNFGLDKGKRECFCAVSSFYCVLYYSISIRSVEEERVCSAVGGALTHTRVCLCVLYTIYTLHCSTHTHTYTVGVPLVHQPDWLPDDDDERWIRETGSGEEVTTAVSSLSLKKY